MTKEAELQAAIAAQLLVALWQPGCLATPSSKESYANTVANNLVCAAMGDWPEPE